MPRISKAEEAVKELQREGIDMRTLSMVGKDSHTDEHVVGLNAVGAGLHGLGIPKDSVVQYELALRTDKFLLMVHGAASEVGRAKDILANTRPIDVTPHSTESFDPEEVLRVASSAWMSWKLNGAKSRRGVDRSRRGHRRHLAESWRGNAPTYSHRDPRLTLPPVTAVGRFRGVYSAATAERQRWRGRIRGLGGGRGELFAQDAGDESWSNPVVRQKRSGIGDAERLRHKRRRRCGQKRDHIQYA